MFGRAGFRAEGASGSVFLGLGGALVLRFTVEGLRGSGLVPRLCSSHSCAAWSLIALAVLVCSCQEMGMAACHCYCCCQLR